MDPDEDTIVSVLPIHYSNSLSPNIHIHQFPLLNRPLQVPPSAQISGKRISARIKPNARRLEIHVPADTRPQVWNAEKARVLGSAQEEDDREKNQETKQLKEGEEHRLSEIRLKSEEIPQRRSYMLGIMRGDKLHLHPINETQQLRPILTHLDILSRKTRRTHGASSDSESDDGPPPDPDEPVQPLAPKKDKKVTGEAREVQVTTRKSEDKSGITQGGLSSVRRDMLQLIRREQDEQWEDLEFYDVADVYAEGSFESIFSQKNDPLVCKTDMTAYFEHINGL